MANGPLPGVEHAGVAARFAIALVDACVIAPGLYIVVREPVQRIALQNHPAWHLIESISWFVISWVLLKHLGATPAMLLLNFRVINERAANLSYAAAVKRDALFVGLLPLQVLALVPAYGAVPLADWQTGTATLETLNEKIGPLAWLHLWILLAVWLLDILYVALGQERRSLHDHIAGSYVVTKASFDRLTAAGSSLQSAPSPAQDDRP